MFTVLARLGFNAALGSAAQCLAAARGVDEHHRDGRRLLEECWVLLGNVAMLAASQYVVLHRCGFWEGSAWVADSTAGSGLLYQLRYPCPAQPPAASRPCRNAGCTYLSTRACLAGWPAHATDPAVLWYYRLELAWYLHMLLKASWLPLCLPAPTASSWPLLQATSSSLDGQQVRQGLEGSS